MAQIFISYSRVDSEMTKRLVDRLRRVYGSDNVWYDDELHGGDHWWQTILREIAKCEVFIYLLSNEAVTSPYCQAEFTEATRLQKPIITVQIRDRTKLSPELSQIQYVDMKEGISDESLARLIGSIRLQLEAPKKRRALWTPVTPLPAMPAPEPVVARGDTDTPTLSLRQPEAKSGEGRGERGALRAAIPAVITGIFSLLVVIVGIVLPPIINRPTPTLTSVPPTQEVTLATSTFSPPAPTTNPTAAPSDPPTPTSEPSVMPSNTPTDTPSLTSTLTLTESSAQTETEVQPITWTNNRSQNRNVRVCGSESCALLGSAIAGKTYEVVERDSDSRWYLIQLDTNRQGWIQANLGEISGSPNDLLNVATAMLQVTTAPANPQASAASTTSNCSVTIIGTGAPLYRNADIHSDKLLSQLPDGSSYSATHRQVGYGGGPFFYINAGGLTGWVQDMYVTASSSDCDSLPG